MLFVRTLENWEERKLSEMTDDRVRGDRATFVLLSASGYSVPEIATQTGRNAKTIRKWIKLFNATGIEGLGTVIPRKVPYQRKTNRRSLVSLVNDVRRTTGLDQGWSLSWQQLQDWNTRGYTSAQGDAQPFTPGQPAIPGGPEPLDSPFHAAPAPGIKQSFNDWDSLVSWSNNWGGDRGLRNPAAAVAEGPASSYKVNWSKLVRWNLSRFRSGNN